MNLFGSTVALCGLAVSASMANIGGMRHGDVEPLAALQLA